VRVGVADGEDEGETEGANVGEVGTGEADAARVAVGSRLMALSHPVRNTAATINLRHW
jgi:hypothetical protein